MSKKIFRSVIAVAMTVLLASLVITNGFLYNYFNRSQVDRLKEELSLASVGVEQSGAAYFDHFQSTVFRFTLISPDGGVLYDSEVGTQGMENHLDREEIAEALRTGTGSSARYSATLTERTFYEAVRLQNGSVLRISTTQVTIGALILGMLPAICAIILFSVITAIVLSQAMAKSIVRPLERLNLEEPSNNDTYEELAPLLSRLNRQHRQITRQMEELKRRSEEFRQITASMQEGLVLLDREGCVLSINPAAKTLFRTEDSAVGQSFLVIDRSEKMRAAVEKALTGRHSEFREERGGGEYQFMISPTETETAVFGAVMLCIDVTQTAFAERNRREFTANVSHELKTPLQSIIGSAELLQNGLVKAEDTPRFVGNIKTEAERLVALINDIIRLSRLDEQTAPPLQPVELYGLVCEVTEALGAAAAKKGVRLFSDGVPCTVNGVRSYLYEILYNLCDNAIRYNREGGEVHVTLSGSNGNAVLTVRDTGIGIPPEDQGRIFERFYRVDKSHSRETGGTGLGLSIVKHAVACHGGTVRLESALGRGTTVIVTLQEA